MFTITEFLHQEVKPALGCTEPGAVALAVAKACEQLDGLAEKLEVVVSDNIFKNGIAVGVPGTGGERGKGFCLLCAGERRRKLIGAADKMYLLLLRAAESAAEQVHPEHK